MYFALPRPRDSLFIGPSNVFDHFARFCTTNLASPSLALVSECLTGLFLLLRNFRNCFELAVTGSADGMRFFGRPFCLNRREMVGWTTKPVWTLCRKDNCASLLGCTLVTIPTELSWLPLLRAVNEYSGGYKSPLPYNPNVYSHVYNNLCYPEKT